MQQFNVTPSAEMRQNVLGKALTIQRSRKPQRLSGIEIWRRTMHSQSTKVAAAFLVIFTVLFGYNFFQGSNGSAFADVIEKLAATQTAQFDLTIEFGEQLPQTSTFYYQSPNKIRQEMANGIVNIVNDADQKVLSLDPNTMTAVLKDVQREDFHTALYELFHHFHELIDQAVSLNNRNVLSLGAATINGKNAYGYQIDTFGQEPGLFWQGRGTLTIWADAETDIPLKLQWYSPLTNIRTTASNIALNLPLDPALFRLDIPEGFQVENFVSTDPSQSQADAMLETAIQLGADIPADKRATVLRVLSLKEDDLIKGLATYLEFSGGSYPPTLNASREFMSHLNELANGAYETQKIDKQQFEAKVLDIGFATFFYDKLIREKKDPAYYGGSLTVNDTDKVLVRWKLSKDRYRVVFGSLTAKTVSADELSELENQTSSEQ
jgi:outer membrane lipoprotein-sorting protein